MHPRISDYLHLPVQSGSDRVLRRMGRGYEIAGYHELVRSLRSARPSIAISTDLIVGFPGESEEDFEATLELVRSVRFSALFAFRYSPRPGTAAPRLDGAIPEAVADERLQRVLALQNEIQEELNGALVGRELEVLVTGEGRGEGRFQGRTSCHRIVHFDAPSRSVAPGTFQRVRIDRALPHSLLGSLPQEVGSGRPEGRRLPIVA